MIYFNNLKPILTLFLPLFVGIIFYKMKFVEKTFPKDLSKLLFNVLLPCNIFVSMDFNASLSDIVSASPLHMICILWLTISYFVSKPIASLIEKDKRKII